MMFLRIMVVNLILMGAAGGCASDAESTGQPDIADPIGSDSLVPDTGTGDTVLEVQHDVTWDGEDGEVEGDTTLGDTSSDGEDSVHPDSIPDTTPVELQWGACDTTWWPTGYPTPASAVECTTIEVPLDHADPGGERITLRVGRHRSTSHPTGKALFHLAGGPGGASVVQSGIIPLVMAELLDEFDQVYIDQRGTGGSERMDCAGGNPETKQDWVDCAQEYKYADLNHFLTVDAAHDIEYVRVLLGYDKIYLRGGSYGTRLGLEFIRQFESSVVAAVLDGLAPPDLDLFGEDIRAFDHGVALLIADCEKSAQCQQASPSLAEDLTARRESLRSNPQPITIDGVDYVEDEGFYLAVLESFLYSSEFRFQVPRAVHEAVGGDPTLWYEMASEKFGYTIKAGAAEPPPPQRLYPLTCPRRHWPTLSDEYVDYVAAGLFMTVMCAEWYPNSGGIEALQAIAAQQVWGDGRTVALAEACAAWNVDSIDAVLRQPVVSDVPVLLVSGAIDLNTWPEWGEQAAQTLSNGTHLVVPYASHSTLYSDCAAQIMSDFIQADGAMTAVDITCLDSIEEPAW